MRVVKMAIMFDNILKTASLKMSKILDKVSL